MVFRQWQWNWDAGDRTFYFGAPSDVPVIGDWNGDGYDEIGVFRSGQWFLDNGNGYWDGDDQTCYFGTTSDIPVAGDWNGDGADEIGVFRHGVWFLDYNGSGSWDAGDLTYYFGISSDKPIALDWYNDAYNDIFAFRSGAWYLDANGSGSWDGGDLTFYFGAPSDVPIAETGMALAAMIWGCSVRRMVSRCRRQRFMECRRYYEYRFWDFYGCAGIRNLEALKPNLDANQKAFAAYFNYRIFIFIKPILIWQYPPIKIF